jgi:hypothetical protein
MLGVKRNTSRRHPTSAEAAEALAEGRCLYSLVGNCSANGKVKAVGLRDREDIDQVLVCGGHYPRLRQMPDRELEQMRRDLRSVFAANVVS